MPTKLESERAYDALVDRLLNGTISEDQPLSERTLSAVLGFGRTPVREAVRDLVREGVLESHPTRGTVVRPLSIADLQDLYEIRFAIEGLAASLAAERGPVHELEPFALTFEKILANDDNFEVAETHDHGVSFHKAVMRLSGNQRLLEMYHPFRLRFRIPFGIVRRRTPERVRLAVLEHQQILQAIMRRDAEQARILMCQHLRKGLDFRMEMLMNRSRYNI